MSIRSLISSPIYADLNQWNAENYWLQQTLQNPANPSKNAFQNFVAHAGLKQAAASIL